MALTLLNTDPSLTIDSNSDGVADVLGVDGNPEYITCSIDGGQRIDVSTATGMQFGYANFGLYGPFDGAFSAKPNTKYRFSFQYKTIDNVPEVSLAIATMKADTSEDDASTKKLPPADDWTPAMVTITTGSDAAYIVFFGEVKVSTPGGAILIRNLQVSYGTMEKSGTIEAYDAAGNSLGLISPSFCQVTEDLNGAFEVSIEHPIDPGEKWKRLVRHGIVDAGSHRGRQKFRLFSVEQRPLDHRVVAYGRHISYDLKDNFIESARPVDDNGQDAGDIILDACQYAHNFTFSSDIESIKTAYYIRTNPVQALMGDSDQSFINRWGGEIERDNYDIAINSRIGSDQGLRITYRKNLSGLVKRESTKNIVTRIYPYATGAGNTVYVLPEKYIDSPQISDYPYPIIATVKYTDIQYGEDYASMDEVYDEMRARVSDLFTAGIDKPDISFLVDFVDLSKTTEYAGLITSAVNLGDDVTVYYEPLEADLSLRVVNITWDSLKDRAVKITVGAKLPDLSNHVASIDSDIARLKNNLSSTWFDERSQNIIPCYESIVYAGTESRNIAMTQEGNITGARSVTIGQSPVNSGDDSIVIGHDAESSGDRSVSIGYESSASEDGVAIGSGSTINERGVAICGTASGGEFNTVVGWLARQLSGGSYNTLIGADIKSWADENTLIGYNLSAGTELYPVGYATIIGSTAGISKGEAHVLIGYMAFGQSGSSGFNTIIGSYAVGNGDFQTVVGSGATANRTASSGHVVIGYGAQSDGDYADIIIGQVAKQHASDGESNILISGIGMEINGSRNIILGGYNPELPVEDDDLISIGYNQVVSGSVLPAILSGYSNRWIRFQAVKTDESPVRIVLLDGQTGYASEIYDSENDLVGGFVVDGGSEKIYDQNATASKRVWVGDKLPASPDSGTVYLKQLNDTDIWGAM